MRKTGNSGKRFFRSPSTAEISPECWLPRRNSSDMPQPLCWSEGASTMAVTMPRFTNSLRLRTRKLPELNLICSCSLRSRSKPPDPVNKIATACGFCGTRARKKDWVTPGLGDKDTISCAHALLAITTPKMSAGNRAITRFATLLFHRLPCRVDVNPQTVLAPPRAARVT